MQKSSTKEPKIGLLGGSFNPAHEGHVYISQKALQLLGLDEVWWLVSPQNPLKQAEGMLPFAERFAKAKELAACCREILLSAFESQHKTTYTYDTLLAIKAAYPDHKFVWLMGADNLLQFAKWHKWHEIMQLVPVAVFNRGGIEIQKALSCQAATEFASYKIANPQLLALQASPAWVFLDIAPSHLSSTQLRGE
jgi:nicotinate-nucleotide adenylyltransferase